MCAMRSSKKKSMESTLSQWTDVINYRQLYHLSHDKPRTNHPAWLLILTVTMDVSLACPRELPRTPLPRAYLTEVTSLRIWLGTRVSCANVGRSACYEDYALLALRCNRKPRTTTRIIVNYTNRRMKSWVIAEVLRGIPRIGETVSESNFKAVESRTFLVAPKLQIFGFCWLVEGTVKFNAWYPYWYHVQQTLHNYYCTTTVHKSESCVAGEKLRSLHGEIDSHCWTFGCWGTGGSWDSLFRLDCESWLLNCQWLLSLTIILMDEWNTVVDICL